MPDNPAEQDPNFNVSQVFKPLETRVTQASAPAAKASGARPTLIKNRGGYDIAICRKRLGGGGFGDAEWGSLLNPFQLLAERMIEGEEDPSLFDLPVPPGMITDPSAMQRIYDRADALWKQHEAAFHENPERARAQYDRLLRRIDPKLLNPTNLNNIVIKLYKHASVQGDNTETKKRFYQENSIHKKLMYPSCEHNPNIAHRYGFGEDPARGPFIILEFVPGKTLGESLRDQPDGRYSLKDALFLLSEIAMTVAHMHNPHSVVHRDLKPANVIIRESDGVPIIIDFSISKDEDNPITLDGQRMGTPNYMSPEQARGEKGEARTDTWALGIIMYELLTGSPAYLSAEKDPAAAREDFFARVTSKYHPRLLSQAISNIPNEICELVEAMRAKDWEDRPTDDELLPWINGLIEYKVYEQRPQKIDVSSSKLEENLNKIELQRKRLTAQCLDLKAEIHYRRIEEAVQELEVLVNDGKVTEAAEKSAKLSQKVKGLPEYYEPLKQRARKIEDGVRLHILNQDALDMLAVAQEKARAKDYLTAHKTLAEGEKRLNDLPTNAKPYDKTHEAYQEFNRVFTQRRHISTFETIHKEFVAKVAAEYKALGAAFIEGKVIAQSQIDAVKADIAQAEKKFAIFEASEIGTAYEPTKQELDMMRETMARVPEYIKAHEELKRNETTIRTMSENWKMGSQVDLKRLENLEGTIAEIAKDFERQEAHKQNPFYQGLTTYTRLLLDRIAPLKAAPSDDLDNL
jgi:serine/threonine protein kinase